MDHGECAFPYSIRLAQLSDVPALAALHVRTFNETHRGGQSGGPSYEVRERQWHEAFGTQPERWFCFVIEDAEGTLIGFAKGTPHTGGVPGFAGELNKLYVLKRFHRQGLGRMLVCRVANEFLARGITSMLLFGDAASPSNGFYERLGAERLHSAEGEFHGAYGWRDIHTLLSRCGDAGQVS